jgi:hypothetical protein
MSHLSRLCVAGLALLVSSRSLAAQAPPTDTNAVVAVVQRLFDAMASGDTVTLRAVLLPGMQFVALTTDAAAAPAPRIQSDTAFVQRLGSRRQRLLERMWNPVVQLQGPIATVWTPYDFHIDGKFSHCGIDSATLVWTAQGWRIAGLTYTVQRTGCAASPLGPPR